MQLLKWLHHTQTQEILGSSEKTVIPGPPKATTDDGREQRERTAKRKDKKIEMCIYVRNRYKTRKVTQANRDENGSPEMVLFGWE